jgi:hypothetical protein
MSSAITKRILWKEYRTQRGLWGALILCTVLFQLLIVGLAENREAATQMVYVVGVMLTLCYAAGCGAISFASEREEGTQLRLQALVCPPVWTVTLKLGFAVLTTVVMVGLGLTTAWLLTGTSLLDIARENPDPQELMGLGWVLFIYGAVLLWTMFFSLLTRSVLSAIGLGAVGAFCFIRCVAVLLHASPMRHYGQLKISAAELAALAGVVGFSLLLVVIANYVLASRWFRRHSGEAPKVKRFALLRRFRIRASSGGGSFVLKVDTEVSHADDVLSPGEAATQPCPRAGLSWLYLAWGSLTWRTLRFLRWRESHESRWRFMLFFGVCLLITQSLAHQIQQAIDLAEQFPGRYSNNFLIHQPGVPFLGLIILAFTTGCGILSFRQEHAGEQFRVLRDRGVSARHLWLSKHLV